MKIKVRKKPVRKAERADAVKIKVHYNGIKLHGKYYTFGNPEELWKYVGYCVEVTGNKVFNLNGNLLGYVNYSDKASCKSDKSYSFEDIRSYIAANFEEYKKTHPLGKNSNSESAPINEAEKKRYANFLWEFMNFVVRQD